MLKVEGLKKTYVSEGRSVPAVKGISFQVRTGEFYTLLGPSGCGKTTTLRCVAGLEQPDAGKLELDGQVIFCSSRHINMVAHKRGLGMVFQSYAIWPHMNVFDNVAFPLVYGEQRLAKREVRERVMRALKLVHLDGTEERPAPFLSGGQQQRAALARALVYEPKMLLLDEPLSNLDAKLRGEMRLEIKELLKRVNITTLYVTHDQAEALSMSDRIAVMNDGYITQEGSPRDIYLSPRNGFTATFIGKINILEGHVISHDCNGGNVLAETPCGRLACYWPATIPKGSRILIAVRPESITLYQTRPDLEGNIIEGRVERATFIGDALECEIKCGSVLLRAKADPLMEFNQQCTMYLYFPPHRCHLLDLPGTQRSET